MAEKYHEGGVVGDLENGNGLSIILLRDDERNHVLYSLLSRILPYRRHGGRVQSEVLDQLNPFFGRKMAQNFTLSVPEWVEWNGYVIAQIWLQPWR